MKKIGSIILVLAFLIGMMQMVVTAQDNVEDYTSIGSDCEVDVYIPEDISPEVRAKILAYMFGEGNTDPEQDRNILCTLFGHSFETTTTYAVTHNVYTTSPKCVRNTYKTNTCTRCGYVETELVRSERISTCHG